MARKRSLFFASVERLLGRLLISKIPVGAIPLWLRRLIEDRRIKRIKFIPVILAIVIGCCLWMYVLPHLLLGTSLGAQSLRSPNSSLQTPHRLPPYGKGLAFVSQSPHQTQVSVTNAKPLRDPTLSLLEQGREFYQNGQYTEAIGVWRQAIASSQSPLTSAMLWSNLSLAYQKLGQWQEAREAIISSFKILDTMASTSTIDAAILKVKAQVLNTRGSLEFARGETEASLATWQEATSTYTKVGDSEGEFKGLLNQVQALKTLGFYRRALSTLETANHALQTQPDSLIKANSLRSLGDILQLVGDLDRADRVLQQSLTIARQLNSSELASETLLSLGNLARLQSNPKAALEFYQEAIAAATANSTKVQAQLNQLSLLVQTKDFTNAQVLFPQIQTQITQLPASRDTIYTKINLANSLMQLQRATKSTSSPSIDSMEIAKILAGALEQAQSLSDRRAISHTLGTLGTLYEQTQQFSSARDLTQKAISTAQAIDAGDIAYLWQWQLGRLLKAQGNVQGAIAAYTEAVNTLQALRGDLIAVNPGVQFSFRDSVEPVYRQLVTLLLSDNSSNSQNGAIEQQRLKQAQNTLESLQLAELINFFRADCLTANAVDIAKVDRTAAVLYPIILENSLEVILSLPQQPLQHYATPIARRQVEDTIASLRLELRDSSSSDYLANVQLLYDWLIRPAASQIARSKVNTLVFVLDGELRNIPMAALHDGQRFLAETYNISLTPGLQLLDPKPLAKQPIAAITAGLSQVSPSFAPLRLNPLPNVEREIQQIQAQIPSTVLLNQTFTGANLEKAIDTSPFPIVHLATHGKFSSKLEETYLLTWDGRINIEQLNQLMQERNRQNDKVVELLILSACETARGDKRAALGLAGIAVRAGTRSTIASLWSVDDEATATFMTALYKNLANKNTNKAEALRQAQMTLLSDRQLNHPYYWAPFVLLGNWL